MSVIETLADMPQPMLPAGAEERKSRRRIAEALMMQGIDTSPIRSWSQGAARVAQALAGGYELGQVGREASAADRKSAELQASAPWLETTPAAAPAPTAATTTTAPTETAVPASIRNNNPGAQWPGPSAATFGSTGAQPVAGNNKIATFPDPVSGAAAQFDLLAKNYAGMPLSAAIAKWSGNNNAPQYVDMVSRTTGLTPDTVITPELIRSPQGIALARAMARHEAGRDYPLSPEQWGEAQSRAFAQQPAPAAVATRSSPQIDPATAKFIKKLLASTDERNRALGQQYSALFAKPTSPKWQKLDEATLYDEGSGRVMPVSAAGYDPLVDPTQRAKYGIPADDKRPYQVGPGGKLINPPAETRFTVDQRGESKFSERAGGLMAERFNDYIKARDDATGLIFDLNALREIAGRIPDGTGKTAQIKAALGPYAELVGVKIDDLPDLQAYDAIVSKMVPRMRVPGSGATSDFEMQTFAKSVPGLAKTPEGNAIISNTLQAMQEHRQAMGEIASRAMAGELKPAEAEKHIRELPDPMELWRKWKGGSPAAAVSREELKKKYGLQ